MRLSFQHNSTQTSVRNKIEEAVGKAFDLGSAPFSQFEFTWVSNKLEFSFAVMGKTIKGIVDITETNIIIDIDLPLMFRFFEDKVKTRILGTLSEMFPQSESA